MSLRQLPPVLSPAATHSPRPPAAGEAAGDTSLGTAVLTNFAALQTGLYRRMLLLLGK